jgi:hypothetical protein
VQAVNVHPQAIGALLERRGFGRFAVIAEGDPIAPPLDVLVEAGDRAETDRAAVEDELRAALGAAVRLSLLAPGTLPVAEHKTRLVYRARPGEPLPPDIAAARPNGGS